MEQEDFIAELKRQSGKPLESLSIARLWHTYLAEADMAVGDRPEVPRRLRRANHRTDSPASANQENRRNLGSRRTEQHPASLADWVKVNRALRGAKISPSNRHKLLDEDIQAFLEPRCGHWQISSDRNQRLPKRLRNNRSWLNEQEHGWTQSELAIYIDVATSLPHGMQAEQFRTAVERAITTWNQASVGIAIRSVPTAIGADVIAGWTSSASDPHRVLAQRVLAHADYPPPNSLYTSTPPLSICFNRMAMWSQHIVDDVNDTTRYDIESFALHEIGHCLGLFHRDKRSIMYEIIAKGRHRTIDNETIHAARALYRDAFENSHESPVAKLATRDFRRDRKG